MSPGLIQKVSATDKQWNEDELVAKSNGAINVDIDSGEVLKAIAEFNITRRGGSCPFIPILFALLVYNHQCINGILIQSDS